MIRKMHLVVVLLAAVLALGPIFPALAQGGRITLVPFTDEDFGVAGVIPEGWSEAGPGVYARGDGSSDITTLIIQAVPGMTAQALTGVLLPQLGIDALPDGTATLETAAYTWTLYEIGIEQAGMSIQVDLALAENETGVTLVLLLTLKEDYAALHEAVFLPVIQALAPIGAETGAGEGSEQEAIYEDPAGKFSVPVPTNWTAEQREGYVRLYSPDELITVSLLVIETDDPEEALAKAWATVDPSFDKTVEETTEIPAPPLKQFVVYTYKMDGEENFIVQAEVRIYEGLAYVGIIHADLAQAEQRQAQLQIIDSGFKIAAIEATDLSAVEPLPLTDGLIAEFEAYIQSAMATYETPGVAVAIVRDGEVVYANGFGVRNPQGDPVTPETRMMIGSTTKTMTTLLMAQMVDDGRMEWETPVIEILPTFAVADPELTKTITMENMVCACTGVPRRDAELVFNAGDLTAEGVIESLATFEFFTAFGEAYQYSNQMVSAAGYLTALAAGGEYGTLYDDYVTLMEERIFSPLGMGSTTFSFDEVLGSDNFAVPYGLYMDFSFKPLPFEVEKSWLDPTGPAGEAWSTVLDMATYMIMELNQGVAADGTRIVSAENLAHTWEPQVAMSALDEYGLGWIVSDYHGLQLLSHAGNTLGFTSEFAFLPERGLGVVVLTNQRLSFLNSAVAARLLEMFFEQPYTADEGMQFSFGQFRDQYLELRDKSERIAKPEAAALAVGSFTNDALGDVTISLNSEGVLIFDAGEFQSELWLYTPDEGQAEDRTAVSFLCYDPPLTGTEIRFEADDAGIYQMTLGGGVNEYVFERLE
jgi:CubicO group peptidase (beta-lactamase class C family)